MDYLAIIQLDLNRIEIFLVETILITIKYIKIVFVNKSIPRIFINLEIAGLS